MEWNLTTFKISDLKKFSKNPRQLSRDQNKHLTDSIKTFGLIDKPILNRDKTIIGGHQRVKICEQLGYTTIDCWYPSKELSPKEIEELCLRLNKNTGSWDYDILANEWDIDTLLDVGFDQDDLIGHLDEEEEQEKPKSKKTKTTQCPECGHEFTP